MSFEPTTRSLIVMVRRIGPELCDVEVEVDAGPDLDVFAARAYLEAAAAILTDLINQGDDDDEDPLGS